MKQRVFIFDPKRCFGCNGCTAACSNANGTPPGLLWRTVHKLPPAPGDHFTVYLSVSCNHCADAPCVTACPSNALEKRASDGVVIHHADKCIGCRYCQMACPYDAIKWDEVRGVVSKCHFCHERLDAGREPACVETCFAGALMQTVIETDEEPSGWSTEAPGLRHLEAVNPSIRFAPRADVNAVWPPAPASAEGEIS
jgi:Fe-S-cluster-containing dehydrogenase component